DAPDLVVVDMGGTSFDVSAVRDGQLVISPEAMLTEFDMLGIPKVDVRSVGAGGGSIAHVDAGGLLRVGPESAGADPGPACYGLGGTRPTVTDADVVLGIIDPDYFLGGRMRLDKAAAERAVGTIAEALGIELAAAARVIASTVDHTMIAAIEDITVQEGIDPRESYFVAGGGATAVHMGQMARVLGIKGYMVPKFSAGLSAFGGLISDIVWEETGTLVTDAARFDLNGVNGVLATLMERGRAFLARAGIAEADQRFEYAYLGRYQYQSWEIEVPFATTDGALAADDVPGLADGFHRMHERIYTIKNENDLVEFTTWKVRAIGPAAADLAPAKGAAMAGTAEPRGTRQVHLPGRSAPETVPVYRGNDLAPGATIAGPAIVEEATTTVLAPEDAEAVVDTLGNYRVTLS
ncbi:MAG: hydantoinase/oxoprolinase family protein, partial [Rhodospirillaceae bacterium]|nr:hydantoinase/oxoprolinase family protein [Rhodospirillaceae bacterium]